MDLQYNSYYVELIYVSRNNINFLCRFSLMYNQLLSFALKSGVYCVKKLNCTVERLVKLVMIQFLKRIKTKTLESIQISNLLSTEIVKKTL